MTTFMKNLFWSITAGLTMFVFLPEAKAQARRGMMMGGRQMMMNSNMMGHVTTPNMTTGNMMNGAMMNGTMTGNMMGGRMMTGTMMTPFNSTNGFGGVGNQGFGFSGNGFPASGFGGYGGGLGGLGGYGGSYGGGLGGYGLDSLYPNAYAPTDSSSTSRKKSQKHEPIPTETPEQERKRLHEQGLAWSRSELPESQATSAAALNFLLTDLQGVQGQKVLAPDVTIDRAVLASINVVVNGSNGNIGVLKHEGRIPWPATLMAPEFDAERQRIESSIHQTIDDAVKAGAVHLHDLNGALATMHSHLAGKIQEIPDPEYIRAKRLLDQLDDAVKLLGESDAGNYFKQIYTPEGRTVAQLVQSMTRRNLRFAPAVAGDESAYLVLHRALAEYDLAVHSQLGGLGGAVAMK